MDAQQKGIILTLLKTDEMNRSYQTRYWFSYKDSPDPKDPFTDFACADTDEKLPDIYCILTAKIFIEGGKLS